MKVLEKILLAVSILFICGIFTASAEEFDLGKFRNTEQEEKISILDFKETPICDVFKVFTDLTGKNIVAGKDIMKLKITLFLKGVSSQEALKTMCKLYNLWFSEEDSVIRIMTAQEYGKELTIRRDEKTVVYELKYASCLAVADLLDNLFGNRIEYVEPEEIESYGHVGTEEKGGIRGRSREKEPSYKARTARETFVADRRGGIEKELSSKVIEELERKAEQKEIELKDIIEAKREQAIVYLAVFPRNNSIVCRSVDLRILNDIGAFIKKMDTPTSQVLLEGKILEITLTDDFNSFFDFDVMPHPERGKHITDVGEFTSLESATFIYQFVDKQVDVRMELFEENNQVKVIGTPMILCANNAPGEFFIGEERPITVNYEHEIREYQERTTETVRPVIKLRDIGTKLIITPSINEDRTVTMRFLAEVDSVKPGGANISLVNQAGEVITLPIDTVDTSRVENIIMASDGSTLAIGGLIRENTVDYERKVPLLGDIPLLGFFFKKKGITKEKTETVFLITPHIMMSPEEGEGISDKALSGLSDHPYIKDKQKRLLRYEEEELKEIESLQSIGHTQTGTSSPQKNVQEQSSAKIQEKVGEVLSVNPQSNFAIIDLGWDDGIYKGDIFSIYREDRFIDMVEVVNLRSNVSSVGAIDQGTIKHIKQGDKVKGLSQ